MVEMMQSPEPVEVPILKLPTASATAGTTMDVSHGTKTTTLELPQASAQQPEDGTSEVLRTRSAKSFTRQNSDGSKRRRSSRREGSDHEIIRRRSSRMLDRTTTHDESTGPPTQRRSSMSENPRRPSQSSENGQRRSSFTLAALAVDPADERKGQKHTEMVERFQIRQIRRTPTESSLVGASSSRSASARNAGTDRDASARETIKANPATRSTAFGDVLRPLQFSHTQATGLDMAAETGQRAMHSNRSLHSHREIDSTLATSRREQSAGPRYHPKPLTTQRSLSASYNSLWQPMSPFSTAFRIRHVILIIALAVHVVHFPLRMAFKDPNAGSTLEMAVEMVFGLDFVLMFNTSAVDKRGALISSRREIWRSYLRGWFLPDCVSSIPMEWILAHGSRINSEADARARFLYVIICRAPRVIHAIGVVRFICVLRLDRSDKNVLTWLFYSRYSHLFRIAWIVLALVLVAHYLACSWKVLRPASGRATMAEEYIANFYDVLQLLQGQGVPTNTIAESVFSAAAILMGSIALAIVFGHVGILVSNFNANSTNYQRKMESVFAIMSKLQLPAPLRERIHQYYEHLWREYESLDGEIMSFAKGLSHTLELEVVLFKYMDLIMHVPFWSSGSPDFQKQLMLHLSVRVYLPDDFIIRRGEVGEEFFMINRGVCEMVVGPESLETTTPQPLDDDHECESQSSCNSGSRRGNVAPRGGDGSATGRKAAYGGDGSATARNDRYDKLRAPLTARRRIEDSIDSFPRIQVLRRGQTFGELALLMNYERTADVRALTYVEMCVLKRADVQAIFVKHPKDRKEVITQLLTRSIEHNEKNQVPCPLRAVVQSVINDGDEKRHFSAMHAAMMITGAISVEQEDDSIKFGIGPSLHKRLHSMLRTHQSPKKDRDERQEEDEMVATRSKRASHRSGVHESCEEDLSRIAHLEATQLQLLELVHEMRKEVQDMRRAYMAAVGDTCGHQNSDDAMTDVATQQQQLDSTQAAQVATAASIDIQQHDALSRKQHHFGEETSPHATSDGDATDGHAEVPMRAHDAAGSDELLVTQLEELKTAAQHVGVSHNPPVIKPKVRPTIRARQASFRETTTVYPIRTISRTSSTMSAHDRALQVNGRLGGSEREEIQEEAAQALAASSDSEPAHRSAQRAMTRASLISPLRSFVATLVPTNASPSSAPLADQLFHTRSSALGSD